MPSFEHLAPLTPSAIFAASDPFNRNSHEPKTFPRQCGGSRMRFSRSVETPRAPARNRRGIDDGALLISLLYEMQALEQRKGPMAFISHHAIPLLLRELGYETDRNNPGTLDQDVESAELLHRFGSHSFAVCIACDVS